MSEASEPSSRAISEPRDQSEIRVPSNFHMLTLRSVAIEHFELDALYRSRDATLERRTRHDCPVASVTLQVPAYDDACCGDVKTPGGDGGADMSAAP